jgi:hypothetical protein
MFSLMPMHLIVTTVAIIVFALVGALIARLSIPAVRAVVKSDLGPEDQRRLPRDL